MQTVNRRAHQLFLFNPLHNDFVAGEVAIFPTAVTRQKALKQYIYLLCFIALPMIVIITVLVALIGYRIELLLLVQLFTAAITCAYFILNRYFCDRVLRYHGTVLYGEVLRQEVLPSIQTIGSGSTTRIIYRFMTPDEQVIIDSVDMLSLMNRLPDGRKYPEAGVQIAVLYANKNNHKLL